VANYSLVRIDPEDEGEEPISEHATFEDGFAAGTHAVTVEDLDNAYALYSADGTRLARLAYGRLGYSQWAARAGRLVSRA
jgi:hypothetical protein